MIPFRRAAGEAAEEQQMRDLLRVAGGKGQARCHSLRDPEQHERLSRHHRGNDRLEVLESALGAEISDVPVTHPAATLVVPHQPEVFGKEAEPVAPQRALPVVLQAGQPVGRLEQERTGGRIGPRKPNAIRRTQGVNALSHAL